MQGTRPLRYSFCLRFSIGFWLSAGHEQVTIYSGFFDVDKHVTFNCSSVTGFVSFAYMETWLTSAHNYQNRVQKSDERQLLLQLVSSFWESGDKKIIILKFEFRRHSSIGRWKMALRWVYLEIAFFCEDMSVFLGTAKVFNSYPHYLPHFPITQEMQDSKTNIRQ